MPALTASSAATGAKKSATTVCIATLPWGKQALDHARDVLKSDAPAAPLATVTPLRAAAAAHVSAWTREKPFTAALLANQRISARDGSKDIRHIELSLEGANLAVTKEI